MIIDSKFVKVVVTSPKVKPNATMPKLAVPSCKARTAATFCPLVPMAVNLKDRAAVGPFNASAP